MRHLLNHRALLLALCLSLAALFTLPLGCGPGGPTPEEQHIAQLEQRQRQLEAERQRLEAEREAERQAAETKQKRWQFYTVLAGALGVVLLVLGAGLGAQTRRDADPPEPPHGRC